MFKFGHMHFSSQTIKLSKQYNINNSQILNDRTVSTV